MLHGPCVLRQSYLDCHLVLVSKQGRLVTIQYATREMLFSALRKTIGGTWTLYALNARICVALAGFLVSYFRAQEPLRRAE